MTIDLTSRRWCWILVSGTTCLFLGLALVAHLETVRGQAERKVKAVEELSHLLAAAHPLVERQNVDDEQAQAFARQFRDKTAELVRAAPDNPDVSRLAAMADEMARVAEERRRAGIEKRPGPSSAAIRGWFAEYVKAQNGIAKALPAPIAGMRYAVIAGVGVCFAGMLILFAMRRTYNRQLETRERSEQALRASEKKFRDLFENVLEGVYQTSPTGEVIAANPALIQMLGIDSIEDLRHVDVGRDFYADPLERKRLILKLEQEGLLRNEEVRLRRKDGGEITVLENARIVRDSATGAAYHEGSLLDISDRKRAEQKAADYTRQIEEAHGKLELQARQLLEQSFELTEARDKAVRSSRLKSEFLVNLSQEIRAPMDAVVTMAQLLLATTLNRKQIEFADNVRRSAEYLLKVIDDILEYSRIETGQIDLADAPFSLRAAVDRVVEQTAARAEDKGIELAFLVSRDVPDALSGDAARLQQILVHLVDNAIKFTTSGEVAVHVSLARDRAEEALIRFEVEDTGIGISPESFVRLFEPFYQIDGSVHRRKGGVGVGLPIAKGLVERMDGQIGVESEPGQGSLVWFQVRLAKQVGSEVRALETGALKGRSVLVVDDVASSRGMLAQLLSSWDMRVSAADEPAAALEALQVAAYNNEPFDFALLDYDMPGLGGIGLAEAILDDPETARTLLVLMVPHSHRGWQDEPLLDGIAAVLSKPVRELQLLEVLTAVAEAARPADLRRLQRHISEPGVDGVPASSINNLLTAAPSTDPWILIVEDNVVNQKVTKRLVGKMGCRSEVASNGEEALAALERRTFSLILMDCQMPVMDGFAATAAIRKIEGNSPRTPIIAMTANAMKGDREQCLNAGMDDYLSKPVSYEDLRSTVTKWVDLSVKTAQTA